jgi:3-hydroxyethyl bacteriochlorophyllide a dehydrogenase
MLREEGVLLALAATARHAIAGGPPPELIVGHGVLGRLLARITIAAGNAPPVVWETNPERRKGATGYAVIDPATDDKRDYRAVCDVSGDAGLLDGLIGRCAKGAEVVLAGFYEQRIGFDFAPAFMREIRIRIASEWQPVDLAATLEAIAAGQLVLSDLITHRRLAEEAEAAYRTAFGDASCLKMIIDWSGCA